MMMDGTSIEMVFITMDPIRTRTGVKLGEEISNLEEYETFYDEGNFVIPGLKESDIGESNSYSVLPLMMSGSIDNITVNHYDIVEIINFEEKVFVVTSTESRLLITNLILLPI